jgi:hypothetical protein
LRHPIDSFISRAGELAFASGVVWRAGRWSTAMDWQTYGLHVEPPPQTDEDEFAYAAGWTISGLATLGTIIAVWIFAI